MITSKELQPVRSTLQANLTTRMKYFVGVSGLVVEYRTRNFQVPGSNLIALRAILQATLSKLHANLRCVQVN